MVYMPQIAEDFGGIEVVGFVTPFHRLDFPFDSCAVTRHGHPLIVMSESQLLLTLLAHGSLENNHFYAHFLQNRFSFSGNPD